MTKAIKAAAARPPLRLTMLGPKAREAAFQPYALALGKLTYSWNRLHEALAQLFWAVTGIDTAPVALAVWHSTPSDLNQRKMLRAAATERFAQDPKAREEIKWLLDKVDSRIAGGRNDAIHAPLILTTSFDGQERWYEPDTYHRNPRAKGLTKYQDLLLQLQLLDQQAETITSYAQDMCRAIKRSNAPWPPRPAWPTHPAPKTKMPR